MCTYVSTGTNLGAFLIFIISLYIIFFYILNLTLLQKAATALEFPLRHLPDGWHRAASPAHGRGGGLVPRTRPGIDSTRTAQLASPSSPITLSRHPEGIPAAPSREETEMYPLSLCQSHAVPLGATSRPGWGPGGLDVPSLLGQL